MKNLKLAIMSGLFIYISMISVDKGHNYHNFFFRDAGDITSGTLDNLRLDRSSVTLRGQLNDYLNVLQLASGTWRGTLTSTSGFIGDGSGLYNIANTTYSEAIGGLNLFNATGSAQVGGSQLFNSTGAPLLSVVNARVILSSHIGASTIQGANISSTTRLYVDRSSITASDAGSFIFGLGVNGSTGNIIIGDADAANGPFTPVIDFTAQGNNSNTTYLRPRIDPKNDTSNVAVLIIDADNADNSAITQRPLLRVDNNGSTKLTLDKDGFLAVGGSFSPTKSLDVQNGTIAVRTSGRFEGDGNGLTNLTLTTYSAAIAGHNLWNATGTVQISAFQTKFNNIVGTNVVSTTQLTVASMTSTILVFTSNLVSTSGFNVGASTLTHLIANEIDIGTQSPNGTLNIVGGNDQIVFSDLDSNQDENKWVIKSNAGQMSIVSADDAYSSFSNALVISRGGVFVSSVTIPNGLVGIGTTDPTSKLDINGGSLTIRGTNAGLNIPNGSVNLPVIVAASMTAAGSVNIGTNSYYGDGSKLTGIAAPGNPYSTSTIRFSNSGIIGVSSTTFPGLFKFNTNHSTITITQVTGKVGNPSSVALTAYSVVDSTGGSFPLFNYIQMGVTVPVNASNGIDVSTTFTRVANTWIGVQVTSTSSTGTPASEPYFEFKGWGWITP